jgi:hypothetical protein
LTDHRPQTESELIEHIRAIDVQAPPELHARVSALVAEHTEARRAPSRARSLRWAGAGALAAAAAVVVAIVLGGGSSAARPELPQTAKLTLAAATLPAPSESPGRRTLAAQVEGVSFPYWEDSLGWNASGARADRVDGKPVRTVFYDDGHGRRIGYAIVGGGAEAKLSGEGGRWVQHNGVSYRLMTINGTPTIAWLRDGHLCVISGHGVDEATLLRLASWHGVAA